MKFMLKCSSSLFTMTILLLICVLSTPKSFSQIDEIDEIACKEGMRGVFKNTNYVRNEKSSEYDLNYYRFHLNIDPAVYNIDAKVDIQFTPLVNNFQSIYFDFATVLNVDSVFYHNQKINLIEKNGNYELIIHLPTIINKGQKDSITIHYHGAPPSGGFGSYIQSTHQDHPVIWTLSEPYGSQDWWPCKNGLDDKIDSLDMYITTDNKYKAASNGLLVEETTTGSTTTFHWKHRYSIAPYLVAFAVTNYERYTDDVLLSNGETLPMINYVYPEYIHDARVGTANLVQVLQFYDSLFVTYPFHKEKYGHAQFGWGGGMEHQTMSFVVNYGWLLLTHELAHQWFGDMVTCGSWQDIWLNEGFATYLEGLTRERFPTKADFDFTTWKVSKVNRITGSPSGSVFVNDTSSVSRIFNSRLSYDKGSYLLHMLRWKLGDEIFFQGVRNYLNELKYKYARTNDLIRHLEAESGQDLTEFFNDWFYGQGFPSYNLTYQPKENKTLALQLNQTTSHPSVPFFEMPVPIEIIGEGHDTIVVLDHNLNVQEYLLELGFEVENIKIDPEFWLISANNTVAQGPVAIEDLIDYKITIAPNPVNQQLKINCNENTNHAVYTIVDMSGRKISAGIIENETINVSALAHGIYILNLKTEKGNKYYTKVIKN